MGLEVHDTMQPMPRRMFVYGDKGVGKSTLAANAPSPVFLQTEDGLADIKSQALPFCRSYSHSMELLEQLYNEPHDFQTLAVDSADWYERLVWQEVADQRGVKSIDDIDFFKGYLWAVPLWQAFLAGLSALREHRGMHVILLGHVTIEKFADPESDSYDRFAPKLDKRASAIVQEWCDEVLYATCKTYTTKTDEGFGRKRTKAVGDGERVLRTTNRPAYIAKNRLGMPDQIPLVWDEIAKYLPR